MSNEQVENEQPSSLRLVAPRPGAPHGPLLHDASRTDPLRRLGSGARMGPHRQPRNPAHHPFETLEESARALRRIEKQKRKRGYL